MEEKASVDSTASKRQQYIRPVPAMLISLLVPCLLYAMVVTAVGDRLFVFSRVPAGRENRAALAIRDDVPAFEKWGSRIFTQGYLRRYYAEYWYFTQAFEGDCKEHFTEALNHALANYPAVDLFLLAHTNTYIEWVEAFPEPMRRRIRFVYNTGCYNEPQGEEWLALGAEAYIGHPGKSLSPYFYFYLLRHWTHGASIGEALQLGNRRMERKFHQLEWVTRGRHNSRDAMRESVASSMGNNLLRVGDISP